jgi:hypothetical protein
LIYCHGGNRAAASVARECGWDVGSRSDKVIYDEARPLALLDIHWTRYDWRSHLAVASAEHPWMAAVPDLESHAHLRQCMEQAEDLAPHCTRLMLIPKAYDAIDLIPEVVGGTSVVLGYSVPTTYGGTSVPLWEFGQRPVHLLGGSPRAQKAVARYLNVVSLDGNMAWKIASRFTRSYAADGSHGGQDGQSIESGAPMEALRKSLMNLREFWATP